MNIFLSLDQQLFLFINHLPHNALFDAVALAVSGVGKAGVIWFALGLLLFVREERKDHGLIKQLVLTGLAVLTTVNIILKPFVGRLRPDEAMGAIILDSVNDPSFPSGHATISWAMAVLLSQKEPRWRWFFYSLAAAISISRIYLGVHYPLDVVAGGLLGWVLGTLLTKRRFSRNV